METILGVRGLSTHLDATLATTLAIALEAVPGDTFRITTTFLLAALLYSTIDMSVPRPPIGRRGQKSNKTYLLPALPAVTNISRRINTLSRLTSLAKRLWLLACQAEGIAVGEDQFERQTEYRAEGS